MTDLASQFGKRLQHTRERRGMTRRELAAAIKCPDASLIWRWENGRISPQLRYLVRLAVELNTSIDALVGLPVLGIHRRLVGLTRRLRGNAR